MTDLACFSCHRINGHGGDMAPDLTWEGSSVQRQWLVEFLKNPNTLRPSLIRRMPKFNLTDGEVSELTDYIMTVYQNPAVDRDSMPLSGYAQGQVELGKQLFYGKYACQGCHIVDTKTDKGYIGPTLTQVGSRLSAAWIYAWMKNPQALRPGTMEPNRSHERRRCARSDRVPHLAERRRQIGGCEEMKRYFASFDHGHPVAGNIPARARLRQL